MSQYINLGNISIPVGSYQTTGGETKKRWRNVGVLMKTTDNGEERFWVKLNAEIFHASLYAMVRATGMEKGDDAVSAQVFAPLEKTKTKSQESSEPGVEEEIPF